MVVDDNATNGRVVEELLRSWGMQPTVVKNPRDALAGIERARALGEPFRLVLTDSSMPWMDGFSLAGKIRSDASCGDTAVVMLTSADSLGDVSRAKAQGIASCLLKPVKASELFEAVLGALDLDAVEEAVAEPPAAEQHGCLGSKRILLVEDSLVSRRVASGLLEKSGYTVFVATNGLEAVRAFESQEVDLVLMDVQMPEMDGLEATAAIRALEKQTGTHVPIVAMTADAMSGDRRRCLEAGMDDYLTKPIRAEPFLKTIETVLGNGDAAGPKPP